MRWRAHGGGDARPHDRRRRPYGTDGRACDDARPHNTDSVACHGGRLLNGNGGACDGARLLNTNASACSTTTALPATARTRTAPTAAPATAAPCDGGVRVDARLLSTNGDAWGGAHQLSNNGAVDTVTKPLGRRGRTRPGQHRRPRYPHVKHQNRGVLGASLRLRIQVTLVGSLTRPGIYMTAPSRSSAKRPKRQKAQAAYKTGFTQIRCISAETQKSLYFLLS